MKKAFKFLSLTFILIMSTCVVSAATFTAGAAENISYVTQLTNLKASQNPSSVKLNCSTLTLGAGEKYTLIKTVSPAGANRTCTWSSNNSTVASVDSSGRVTAKKNGTAYITVKTANGKTAQCKVTVKTAPSSVTTNPTSVTLGVGERYTISENTKSGTYANAANLKWTSTNSSVATVTKGSSNKASITAKGVGTAYVKITLYNGKTAQCKVTVKPAPASVKTNPSSVSLTVGESYTISESTNSGTYANAANLKWTSSNSNVATVTKGSANKATIKAMSSGTAYIKITLYNGKTAQCKVTVNNSKDIDEVLTIINKERVKAGVKPLAARADLIELADIRVKELSVKFSHQRIDGTFVSNLAEQKGIYYNTIGENIAMGQPTAETVMNSWMNSEGHRANILNSSYSYIGIGHIVKNGMHYWVQVFLG